VELLSHSAHQGMIESVQQKIIGYGLGNKLKILSRLVESPSELRWVHVREEAEVPAGFFGYFRNPDQSERQRFVTRINRQTPWIDDDHFLATTQVHRVLSINTALSGDIEKVVI
ncbi:MAG: hypothetical protein HY542_03185, partial [Deltaproteobacteria bacterium]|nr:hypothetical protein [Deltaproteobacteria bacterium]